MRTLNRTQIELAWTCPQAEQWAFQYDTGHAVLGISPSAPAPELQFGARCAEMIAACRRGEAWSTTLTTNDDVLLYGLSLAHQLRIWPNYLKQFEVVGVELECALPLGDDLIYQARPDAVVRRKSDNTLWCLEDKTTSQDAQTFVKQWDKQVQVHATALAVEQRLGESVAGTIVQGWAKGYQKGNERYSPLCAGWRKAGTMGDQWSPTYVVGWKHTSLSEYKDGMPGWVDRLPTDLLNQQFPVTLPIPLRRDLCERFFEQLKRFQSSTDRHFAHCDEFGKYRRPCAYRECCWAPSVGRDPIGSGLFVARTPHHPVLEAGQ